MHLPHVDEMILRHQGGQSENAVVLRTYQHAKSALASDQTFQSFSVQYPQELLAFE